MGILEKIAEIEREISRTQKNKGKRFPAVELIVSVDMQSALCVCMAGEQSSEFKNIFVVVKLT